MTSYIQVPYGYRKVSNPIQFVLPKNNFENKLFDRIGYISNKDDPVVKNNILNAIRNREDLQKFILATSDLGNELQEDINEITGGDEKFNNAVLRRALDLKNNDLFRNPQAITLLFNDVEKFHQQNPIIGKLASQINVSKLSEKDLTKRQLLKGEISKIEDRLYNLKYGKSDKGSGGDSDDDDDGKKPPGGGSAPSMREAEAEIDPSFRSPPERSEKDLQDTFRQLRFGKPTPRQAPPDPFSPDFWHEVSKDPGEAVEDKLEHETVKEREEIDFDKFPSVPLFDPTEREKKVSFSKPTTKLLDGETIEITPPTVKINEEREISDKLQQLFPDVEKISEQNKRADVSPDFENLSETLTAISRNEIVPFEFEFFKGGNDEKFADIIRGIDSSSDTNEFLNFLQSNICKKLLEDNKLKIHTETGNIYYDNNDTNESIHSFILAQANPISGEIDHAFTFDHNYTTYFQWLTDAFNESTKNKLDILTNKNSKFLFYHFNDYLQQSGKEIKKIKHSVVTQDYLAAEKVQDRNWKYFVESVLIFSQKATVSSDEKSFLLETKENVEILKNTYEKLYNQISKNLTSTLDKMPFDLFKNIEDDLLRENYGKSDLKNLDSWVSFYFKQGRFPGNNNLTILPQSAIPKTIDQLTVEVSPVELYRKFGNSETNSLVSFQAIVALFLHYGGDALTAKRAMEEWKNNLTFQALSKENDKVTMQFDYLAKIVFYFLRAFLTLESDFLEYENSQYEIANQTIENSEVKTSTPKRSPLQRPPLPKILTDETNSLNESESIFLKTAFTLAKTNLDASIEAAEEENKEIIKDIIDPTPGFVADEKITDDDFENREYEDENKFRLSNAAQSRFDNILKDITEDINTYKLPNREHQLELLNEKIDDFTVSKEQGQIKIEKSPTFTKVSTSKKGNRRSPYNLRSFKRKYEFLKSEDSLTKPISFEVDDDENRKIKAAETVIDSIVNRLPDLPERKKLKFNLDSNNDIKLTEL